MRICYIASQRGDPNMRPIVGIPRQILLGKRSMDFDLAEVWQWLFICLLQPPDCGCHGCEHDGRGSHRVAGVGAPGSCTG